MAAWTRGWVRVWAGLRLGAALQKSYVGFDELVWFLWAGIVAVGAGIGEAAGDSCSSIARRRALLCEVVVVCRVGDVEGVTYDGAWWDPAETLREQILGGV